MVVVTPIVVIALFYISGLLLSPYLRLSFWPCAGLTLLTLVLIPILKHRIPSRWHPAAYAVFLFWGLAHPGLVRDGREALERTLDGPAEFSGLVVSDPVRKESYTGFLFKADRLNGRKTAVNLQASYPGRLEVEMGDRLTGLGPVGRNDSKYYLSRNLFGNLQVKVVDGIESKRNYWSVLRDVRRQVQKSVTWGMTGDERGLITGLMLGVREDIPVRIMEVFSNTGTIHILAVSGLHLAIIATVIFFITRLFISSKAWNYAILTAGVVLYTLLIGDQASILRAALMTELGIAVYLFDREKNFYNVVGLSALLLLFYNPFTLYNLGFQLSYAAVLGMVAFNPWFLEKLKFLPAILRGNVAVSFSAQMFVFPMVLVYFHKMVLISFLANVPIVPLSSLNIVMGFVSFFVSLTGWWQAVAFLNMVNGFLLEVLVAISAFFAKFFFIKVETLSPFFLAAIFAGIASFFLFINYRHLRSARLAFLGCAAVLSLAGCAGLLQPAVKVLFVNAGTGRDAVLVRDNGRDTLILDLESSRSEKLLKNYLLIHNIKRLHNLVFMSPSGRMDGCAADLVRSYAVDRVYGIGRLDRWPQLREALTVRRTEYERLETVSRIPCRRSRLEIYNPAESGFRYEPSEIENQRGNSLVAGLVLTGSSSGILFHGPVGSSTSRSALKRSSTNLRWRVVYRSEDDAGNAGVGPPGQEKVIARSGAGSTNAGLLDLRSYREILAFLGPGRVNVRTVSW